MRALARDDPKTFFEVYREPLFIDEVQRVPGLLSHIQVRVDEDRRRAGRYILTGSRQQRLEAAVSQSLAGRTAELELLPLSMEELAGMTKDVPTDEILLRGFFPEVWGTGITPTDFHRHVRARTAPRQRLSTTAIRIRTAVASAASISARCLAKPYSEMAWGRPRLRA